MRLVEMPCASAMRARHRICGLAARNFTASLTLILDFPLLAATGAGAGVAAVSELPEVTSPLLELDETPAQPAPKTRLRADISISSTKKWFTPIPCLDCGAKGPGPSRGRARACHLCYIITVY